MLQNHTGKHLVSADGPQFRNHVLLTTLLNLIQINILHFVCKLVFETCYQGSIVYVQCCELVLHSNSAVYPDTHSITISTKAMLHGSRDSFPTTEYK